MNTNVNQTKSKIEIKSDKIWDLVIYIDGALVGAFHGEALRRAFGK